MPWLFESLKPTSIASYWSIGVSAASPLADSSCLDEWPVWLANATASAQSPSCIASFFDHATRAASISPRLGSTSLLVEHSDFAIASTAWPGSLDCTMCTSAELASNFALPHHAGGAADAR